MTDAKHDDNYSVINESLPKRGCLLAHDEWDGVHEVRFTRAIGPDDRCEGRQWAKAAEALVGLEILEFYVL